MQNYYIKNNFCKIKNYDCDFNWYIINHFYMSINNNKNYIIIDIFLIG